VTRCFVPDSLTPLGSLGFYFTVSPETFYRPLGCHTNQNHLSPSPLPFPCLKVSLLVINALLPLIAIVTLDNVATGQQRRLFPKMCFHSTRDSIISFFQNRRCRDHSGDLQLASQHHPRCNVNPLFCFVLHEKTMRCLKPFHSFPYDG
jgi:hypothetical protein